MTYLYFHYGNIGPDPSHGPKAISTRLVGSLEPNKSNTTVFGITQAMYCQVSGSLTILTTCSPS